MNNECLIFSDSTENYKLVLENDWRQALGKILNTTHCSRVLMPSIVSHTFKNGRTTIKWSDGTMTQVACNPDKADMYTGFMIAVAKKAYGNNNTINNLADKWLFKIPKQEAERKAKEKAEKIEQERIAANKARKREINRKKKIIRDEAKRIKEQYEREELEAEAKKMAIEKFGVPADYVNN